MNTPPENFNLFINIPPSSDESRQSFPSDESRTLLHQSLQSSLLEVLSRKDLIKEKVMWISEAVSDVLRHYSIDFESFFASFFGSIPQFTCDIVLQLCQSFPKEIMKIIESHSRMWRSFFGYFEIINAKSKKPSSDDEEEASEEEDDDGDNKSPNVKHLSQLSVERIKRWFGHMSSTGEVELGARALKWYCLAHRDEVWHLTTWSGKRAIMPPVAVKQSQSFMQMDIVGTVCNLLSHPHFWKSKEWFNVIKDGNILSLDFQYFANYLSQECQEDRKLLGQLKSLFLALIEREKVSLICRCLFLSSKPDDSLRYVRSCLGEVKKKDQQLQKDPWVAFQTKKNDRLSLMILVLDTFSRSSFEELAMYLCLASHVSALLKTIGEDKNPFSSLVACPSPSSDWKNDQLLHWGARVALCSSQSSPQKILRFILFESFVIRCRLSSFQSFLDFGKRERNCYEKFFSNEGLEFESIFEERKRKRNSSRSWLGWEFKEISEQQKLCTMFELPETLALLFVRKAIDWFIINRQ